MFDKIRNKPRTIKPFGEEYNDKFVQFILCAYTEEVASELKKNFDNTDQVKIVLGDILTLDCDALVSPANSFGDMGGGIDKIIDDFYHGKAQAK